MNPTVMQAGWLLRATFAAVFLFHGAGKLVMPAAWPLGHLLACSAQRGGAVQQMLGPEA